MAKKFYAVVIGAIHGVFTTRDLKLFWVKGYPDARFKGLNDIEEANMWFNRNYEQSSSESEEVLPEGSSDSDDWDGFGTPQLKKARTEYPPCTSQTYVIPPIPPMVTPQINIPLYRNTILLLCKLWSS
ncbi:hypothetical protein RCL1_008904 [Eukaryota sp. TZLM3-RCL]